MSKQKSKISNMNDLRYFMVDQLEQSVEGAIDDSTLIARAKMCQNVIKSVDSQVRAVELLGTGVGKIDFLGLTLDKISEPKKITEEFKK